MIWTLPLLPALAGLAIWAAGGPRLRLGALAGAAMAATLWLALAAGDWTGSYAWSEAIVLRAALDPLAQAVAVTVPAVALAVVIFAAAHEAARGLPRLVGLLCVFVGGMELVVIAGDLATLLIGWEIVGACSWALIGHHWRDTAPMRSANYAFVMTRAGDLGLFLAVFATYAGAGTLDYAALAGLEGVPLVLAAFGILVAAASKAGQVPFAPWLFRAMDGPTAVSSLLHSAAMVAAGAFLLARLHPALSAAPGFGPALIAVGLTTALAGGLVALREVHAKKVLAGSTSAQLGLMLAATGAGYPGVAVLHLIVHAAFKAPLFFAAGIAEARVGSYDLRRMRLGRALPWTALLTGIVALALAGVPPFSGGWSKEEVVKALGHAGPWLAILGIAAGALSAAYAARFAIMAFAPGEADEGTSGRGEFAVLAALTLATLTLSALWLPPVHDAAARVLGAELPAGSRIELIASLVAVAAGLLAGLHLARHPAAPPEREWLGLSALVEGVAVQPFEAAARLAARVDNEVLDLIPRGTAFGSHLAARRAAWADDRALDGQEPGATDRALAGAVGAWHGLVGMPVRLTGVVARQTSGTGEAASDLVPSGTGRLMGMAGTDLRRLQTGFSHHYYVVLVAGFAAGVAFLILGG